MSPLEEGDYCEHRQLPGVIWQVFEITQIDTVSLNLWYEPPDWVAPPGKRFLFEVLKSGDFVEQDQLCEPNPMEVLAIIRARSG